MAAERERWLRLSRLFDRAVELEGQARADYVVAECADDDALRAELQRMLDADAAASGFDAGAAAAIALDEAERQEDASGGRLGRWRLLSRVGSGGMGTVYAAQREDDSGQRAAVKHLHRRWDRSAQAQRFLQERRILAQLSHPNLPRLIDHGLDEEGRPWFALEYVDGQPLTAAADARRLGLRERLVLMLQVCAAVRHAHERFIVHRDLKPANILVDADGHPKVLDFGVAKRMDEAPGATRTGAFAGFTPEYAAPEQIAGGPISAATDVHALGVVLYELLSGTLPHRFEQADLRSAAEAITDRSAERLDRALTTGAPDQVQARIGQRRTSLPAFRRYVRGDLTRIVQTALAKEPARRYSSVQALSDDLERFLDGRPVSVSGDTFGYRARKFVRRNRWGVAMGAVAAAAIVAGMAGFAWQLRAAQAQRDAALTEAARAIAVREYVMLMFRQAADTNEDPSAREVLKRGADEVLKRAADQPDAGLTTANALGELSMTLGDMEGAASLFERMLALPVIARFPADRAKAQLNLGVIEYFRSNLAHSRQLLDAAQGFWLRDPARHRLDLLDSRTLQAQLERAEGKPDASIATLEAGLREAVQQAGGKPERQTAQFGGNLGVALLNAGRLDEAGRRFGESWAMYRALGLQDTSDALGALNGVAITAQRRGDLAGAEATARQVYEARKRLFPDSQDTAMAQFNLAKPIALQGRHAEALPHFRQALGLALDKGGPNGRIAMFIRPALAESCAALGQLDEAERLSAEQLRIAQAQYGEGDAFYAAGLRGRALVRLARRDTAAAAADIAAAEAIYRKLGKPGESGLAALAPLQAQLRR